MTYGASKDTILRTKEPSSDGKNAKSDDSVTPGAGTCGKFVDMLKDRLAIINAAGSCSKRCVIGISVTN